MSAGRRIEKLNSLRRKIQEAGNENRKELYAEHERTSVVRGNDEVRNERKRKAAEQLLSKQDKNHDFERQNLLKYSAEEVEEWNDKQKIKLSNHLHGPIDWADVNFRKHMKLVDSIKVEQQEKVSTNAEVDNLTLIQSTKPSDEVLESLAQRIAAQQKSRQRFPKHRESADNSEIHYINDKNMRFNMKVARAASQRKEDI